VNRRNWKRPLAVKKTAGPALAHRTLWQARTRTMNVIVHQEALSPAQLRLFLLVLLRFPNHFVFGDVSWKHISIKRILCNCDFVKFGDSISWWNQQVSKNCGRSFKVWEQQLAPSPKQFQKGLNKQVTERRERTVHQKGDSRHNWF
jgi:hypothetical protein